MDSEHVEVLRELSEVCRAAIKAGDWKVDGACDPDSLLRHADAAIASLSAPQPPAEAQPRGRGCGDHDHARYIPGCGLCAATLPEKRMAAPPSAPEGVVELVREYRPSMDAEVLHAWAKDIVGALAQQPPAEAQGGGEIDDLIVLGKAIRAEFAKLHAAMAEIRERAAAPPSAATPLSREHGSVQEMFNPSAPVGVEAAADVLHKLRRLALVIREHGTCAPLALDHIGDDLERALAQQPAAVDGADTRRLEWLIANELLVHRLSDTGLWMVTTGDLSPAIDGSEHDTWREAIDAALAGQQGGSDNDR